MSRQDLPETARKSIFIVGEAEPAADAGAPESPVEPVQKSMDDLAAEAALNIVGDQEIKLPASGPQGHVAAALAAVGFQKSEEPVNDEILEKAQYTKRTGTPGHYKYEYADKPEVVGQEHRRSEVYGVLPQGTKITVHHGPTAGNAKDTYVRQGDKWHNAETGGQHTHTELEAKTFGKPTLAHQPKPTGMSPRMSVAEAASTLPKPGKPGAAQASAEDRSKRAHEMTETAKVNSNHDGAANAHRLAAKEHRALGNEEQAKAHDAKAGEHEAAAKKNADYWAKQYGPPKADPGQNHGEELAQAAKTAKKSLVTEGLDALAAFAKSQDLPTGEPKLDQGHSEASPNGGSLESTPEPSSAGAAGGSHDPKAPSVPEEDLQGDGHDCCKPGEPGMAKSYSRAEVEAEIAREKAAWEANLRKGEPDVVAGLGVRPPAAPASEPMEKAMVTVQGPEARVVYSNASDLACEKLFKSDFYTGGEPSLGLRPGVVAQVTPCAACGTQMSKSLTACPACGAGAVASGFVVQKSEKPMQRGQLLRPARREADLVLPAGTKVR